MSHKIKFWLTTCGKRARVCLWQQFHASLEQLATKTDILTSPVRLRRWQSQSRQKENLRSYAMATSLGECWAGWTNMEVWKRRRSKAMAASFLTTVESGAEVEPPLAGRWKRGEHQLISGNQRTNHSHHITASRRRRIIALSEILRLLWARLPWKQGISH